MAYFYCGTEVADYAEHYCRNCVHSKREDAPGFGCPVMDAHWLYAYELCMEMKHPGKVMLDMLIPEGERGPAECAMFHRAA